MTPALEKISNDLGVSITIGGGSYDNKANGHFKVNIATLGEGGEIDPMELEKIEVVPLFADDSAVSKAEPVEKPKKKKGKKKRRLSVDNKK